jgi:hypothetical protein
MTRSEADEERELEGAESENADSEKLARFLTPVPKAKSSFPPAHVAAPAPPLPKSTPPSTPPERTSLFSDLPVPRRNSSLLPPPGSAEVSPRPADVTAEREAAPLPRAADPVLSEEEDAGGDDEIVEETSDEFAPHESSTSNVTLERDLESDARVSEPDLDFLPRARIGVPTKQARIRYAAIGGATLVLTVMFAFFVRRMAAPSRAPLVAIVPSVVVPTAAPPREEAAPNEDIELGTPEPDVAAGLELRKEARRLLEKGDAAQGVAVARRAILADPNAPDAYILLAAGLQDLGRWQESRDVFAKCVQQPHGKTNAECVYFATRSQ